MNNLIIPILLILASGFIWKSLHFYFQGNIPTLTVLLIVFATNIVFLGLYSDLLQPSLLILFYSTLVFVTISWHRKPSLPASVFLGLVTVLIIMLQPTGYFALLIPFIWSEKQMAGKEKFRFISKNPAHFIFFTGMLILVIFLLHFAAKAMPGEIPFLKLKLPGLFIFGSKYLWNDLFSFNHGWLIYTPFLLIPAIGFYFLAENQKRLFAPVFFFCVLDVLAESCWTKLGKTPVFGQIAYVQLYPLLAFPTAFLIARILQRGNLFRWISALIMSLFILMNLLQTWQFHERILPPNRQTAEIYGIVFGRTSLTKKESWRILEITDDESDLSALMKTMSKRSLIEYDFEQPGNGITKNVVSWGDKFGRRVLRMDSSLKFSPGLNVAISRLISESRGIVRISADIYSEKIIPPDKIFLEMSVTHNNKPNQYRISDIIGSGFEARKWQTVTFDYLIPIAAENGDYLQSFIHNPEGLAILVDNIQFDLFE